jgi:hypothetical protein
MFYVVLGMVVIIVLISSGLLIYYLKVAKEPEVYPFKEELLR